MAHLRYVMHFSGHVQGVGFRFTTVRLASRHPITGYVQNLPDGRVVVVAEGLPANLDPFVADIRTSLGQFIVDESRETQPASGEFKSFEIVR